MKVSLFVYYIKAHEISFFYNLHDLYNTISIFL